MILVDTSVLIDYIRKPDPQLRIKLSHPDCAVCGVAWAELLHGVKNAADEADVMLLLSSFQQITIPDTIWQQLGRNLASLRRSGLTVPFQDALLSTVAIHHGAELWSLDAHFTMMQRILTSLQLHRP